MRKRPSLRLAIVALVLTLALAAASSRAQSVLPPDAEKAFQRGVIAAQQQEWSVALRYFEEARKTAPHHPPLLFNLGLAESKLGGRELRAIVWLRAYLAASGPAPNEKAVRELIDTLDVRLEGTLVKLLRQARDLAAQLPPGFDRNNALQRVGEAQAAMGDFPAAKETITRFPAGDDSWPSWVARALGQAGDVAGAKEILSRVKSDIYQSSAYADIAVVQVNAGDLAAAEATLSLATNEGYRFSGTLSVARALFDKGRKAEAAVWRERVKAAISAGPAEARADRYQSLGRAQADADDVQGALVTAAMIPDKNGPVLEAVSGANRRRFDERLKAGDLESARKLAHSITVAATRSSAYLELAKHRLAARDWDESLSAIEEMADSDSWKANAYSDLASALVRAGDVPKARQVLARAASRLGRMDSLFVNYLVGTYVAVGDLPGAKHVISYVRESDRQGARLTYASGQVKAGDLAGAKQTIAGLKEDYAYQSVVREIAGLELAAGNVAATRQTLTLIADAGARGTFYPKIVERQLRDGDLAGALRSAAQIVDVDYRSWAYRDIVNRQLETGQLPAALATAALVPHPQKAADVLTRIATWQADQGDFKEALSTAGKIADERVKVPAYVAVAGAQLAAGYRRGAEDTLRMAKDVADRLKDPAQRVEGESAIATFALSVGLVPAARQSIADAKAAVVSVRDPGARVDLLRGLASLDASALRFVDARQSLLAAVEAAATIADASARPRAYRAIATAQATRGELDEALDTAARIPKGGDRDGALADAGYAYLWAGSVAGLKDLLGMVSTPDARTDLEWKIARVLAERGDTLGAERMAAAMPAGYKRNYAYQALALAHVKAGNLPAARTAVAAITDSPDTDLFVAFARAGDFTWVDQNLPRVTSETSRDSVRARVTAVRVAAGDRDAAAKTLAAITYEAARGEVCDALAATGDVASARECAARLDDRDRRRRVLLRLARERAGRGDLPGAHAIWTALRQGRPGANALREIASGQAAAGDVQAAAETLAIVHPKDGESDAWAASVIATAQGSAKAPSATPAQAIADPYWRDRALLSLVASAEDAATAEKIVTGLSERATQSQGRFQLVTRALKKGAVGEALTHAGRISDVEARACALASVLASGAPGAHGATVVLEVASLPDGAAKAYLLTDLSRTRVRGGDPRGALPLLLSAQTAVRSMTDDLWKARASVDLAEAAARAGAVPVAEAAQRLARNVGDRLNDPERSSWVAYVNRSSPTREAEDTRIRAVRAEAAQAWTRMFEWQLKDAVFTDLSGHLQRLTTQAKSKDILDGLTGTVRTLIDRSKTVQAEVDKEKVRVAEEAGRQEEARQAEVARQAQETRRIAARAAALDIREAKPAAEPPVKVASTAATAKPPVAPAPDVTRAPAAGSVTTPEPTPSGEPVVPSQKRTPAIAKLEQQRNAMKKERLVAEERVRKLEEVAAKWPEAVKNDLATAKQRLAEVEGRESALNLAIAEELKKGRAPADAAKAPR